MFFKISDAGNFTFQIFSVSDQEIKTSRHCEHGTHGCCEEDPEVKVAVVLIDVQLGVKFSILKSGISNSSELVLNSRKHCLKMTMRFSVFFFNFGRWKFNFSNIFCFGSGNKIK